MKQLESCLIYCQLQLLLLLLLVLLVTSMMTLRHAPMSCADDNLLSPPATSGTYYSKIKITDWLP